MGRTFGWVQNPNRLDTLKYITGLFKRNSYSNKDILENRLPLLLKYSFITNDDYDLFKTELEKDNISIKYDLLKGKGVNGAKSRKDALCSGIIQAAMDGHSSSREIINDLGQKEKIKKPYVDDWTSDGYLRWAISTGLLEYDNDSDECKITTLGIELVDSEENSEQEKEAFTKALLSYPPVYRILEILSDHREYTKFEIGSKLGFRGEKGFTSIPQEIFVYDVCAESDTTKKREIKSNFEGDSDKYARTIATWLKHIGWVESSEKVVTETYFGETNSLELQTWKITRAGEQALIKSRGNSRNPKIPKLVMFEMLATKVPNSDYIRLRRAHILKALNTDRTLAEIKNYLHRLEIEETEDVIQDEIKNFKNIGIEIRFSGNKYKLTDKITGLKIPTGTKVAKENITELKDEIRSKLHNVDHDYLVLVDLAYSDASTKTKKNMDAKEFEIKTAKLFTEELSFTGERLGDSNKPDVIISYDKYGSIIDNKSYKDGFNLDAGCRDEMARYVEENKQRIPNVPTNEWWKSFEPQVTDFTFLFITSYLKGNFKKGLEYISTTKGVNGAAIGVDNLLYLAEDIKSGKTSYVDFFDMFNNDEIQIVS